MTSSSHLQLSFGKTEKASLSVYTAHLVEGLETGEADIDKDGENFVSRFASLRQR